MADLAMVAEVSLSLADILLRIRNRVLHIFVADRYPVLPTIHQLGFETAGL